MPNTAIIFARELTSWDHFPGDVPPESKSSWNALSHATQEELKADLAKQGYPTALFSNAFLIPCCSDSTMYRCVGYAVPNTDWHDDIAKKASLSKPSANASTTDRILIYQVDPTQLLNACLHDTHISDISVFNDFIKPFNR